MKILIFGATGMLGHKLIQKLGNQFEIIATCRGSFNFSNSASIFSAANIIENVEVTDNSRVKDVIEQTKPDVVINAVGVIKQLAVSKDVTIALQVNALFPHQLANLSAKYGFRLLAISTDCVFDGTKGNYSESDLPNALDLYGQSKRWGEISAANCLTIRTSIIGHELETHHSLVDWFLSNRKGTVNGYKNAIYSGFPTVVFADIIRDLILNHRSLSGLYHVSSEPINKFELLRLINESYASDIEIVPETDFRIDRSLDSAKFRAETGFAPMIWNKMIQLMYADAEIYGTK